MDIAVIVSTFERLGHLRRCLASIEAQRGVAGRFEVVVTDDGSRDGTVEFLQEAIRRVPYPLRFTTHAHVGFRLARCRNIGVAESSAPYILFTDGDCILPPDHLKAHLAARRPGRVVGGDSIRLGRHASEAVDETSLRRGAFPRQVPAREAVRISLKAMRAKWYELCRTPMRPRLTGNNIGLWRSDFLRINGFDERYVGWGLEDRDLQYRLERFGVRAWSILFRTWPMHLWHEPHPTFTRNGSGTPNLSYFSDVSCRPAFCAHGFVTPTPPVDPDRGSLAPRPAAGSMAI
jgi:glycosyltransferase involved in cell wall biosynthesis